MPHPVLIGGLVAWQDLFSDAELDAIERHGDALDSHAAGLVRPGSQDLRITRVSWFARTPETDGFYSRMEEIVLALNARFFRYDLSSLVPFQYAVYRGEEGGHFDWHKDYGRDAADPQQEPRKLTISLQLSHDRAYQGCDLEVRGGNQTDVAPRARGTLIAFPANVLHRVTPITGGVRKALVAWAAGPEFR